MTHPKDTKLALLAGGDLGGWERWSLQRHIRKCESCASEVEAYRAASTELRAEADALPAGLNWDRLANEMTANIHLGIAAGECVTKPAEAPAMFFGGWRAAAVMSGMSALLIAAWFLNPPHPPRTPVMKAAEVEISATARGLELKGNGSALVLLNGRGGQSPRPIVVSSPGTLRARYVDTDTGQITINNVYSE